MVQGGAVNIDYSHIGRNLRPSEWDKLASLVHQVCINDEGLNLKMWVTK